MFKRKLYFSMLLFVFIISMEQAFSEGWTLKKNNLYAKLSYTSLGALRFWDAEGTANSLRSDTSLFFPTGRRYTYSFDGSVMGLYGEYGLTDDITLIADIPFSVFSLKELWEKDSIGNRAVRTDMQRTAFSWFGFGTRWQLHRGKSVTALSFMLRIPPGFTQGIVSDSVQNPFLGDGAFQAAFAVEFGMPFQSGWFQNTIRYNWRGEELRDELLLHTEYGNKSVEEIQLKLFADILIGLGNKQDLLRFNTRQLQLQETHGTLGGAILIDFTKEFFMDFTYTIRLFGENTWALNGISFGAGMKMQ